MVDFGIIHIAPEAGGIRQQVGTGALWRIHRTDEPQGMLPPRPMTIPLYLLQGLAILGGIVGTAALLIWLGRRLGNNGGNRRS